MLHKTLISTLAKRIVLRGKIAVPASVRAFSTQPRDIFTPLDQFEVRHVGSQGADKHEKLEKLGFNSIDELLDSAVPTAIRNLMDNALSETEALNKLKGIMSKRNVLKSKVQRFGVLMGFGGPRAGFLATTTACSRLSAGLRRTVSTHAAVQRRGMTTTHNSDTGRSGEVTVSVSESEPSQFHAAHGTVIREAAARQIPAVELIAVENAGNQMAVERVKIAARTSADALQKVIKMREEVAVLLAAVRKLEEEDRERILVRQLGYAIQFSLARRFPSIFKKSLWAIPFSVLRSTIQEIGTPIDKKKLAEIEADFLVVGIYWYEIDGCLFELCRMGYGVFNPTCTDNFKDVDIVTMAGVIADAPIHDDLKDFAIRALPLLRKYQAPANPLLATAYRVK